MTVGGLLCFLGFHKAVERVVVTISVWPLEQGTIVDYCGRGHIAFTRRERIDAFLSQVS